MLSVEAALPIFISCHVRSQVHSTTLSTVSPLALNFCHYSLPPSTSESSYHVQLGSFEGWSRSLRLPFWASTLHSCFCIALSVLRLSPASQPLASVFSKLKTKHQLLTVHAINTTAVLSLLLPLACHSASNFLHNVRGTNLQRLLTLRHQSILPSGLRQLVEERAFGSFGRASITRIDLLQTLPLETATVLTPSLLL